MDYKKFFKTFKLDMERRFTVAYFNFQNGRQKWRGKTLKSYFFDNTTGIFPIFLLPASSFNTLNTQKIFFGSRGSKWGPQWGQKGLFRPFSRLKWLFSDKNYP